MLSQAGVADMRRKLAIVAPDGTNMGSFSDQISVHFVLTKSDVKKSRICDFLCLFDPLWAQQN